jgi:hypothetical protein
MVNLPLSKLKEGFSGVTPALGEVLFETCLVCLSNQRHNSGVELQVRGDVTASFALTWGMTATDQMRRSWADLQEATELAATGIAILLILELTNYTIVQRSQKGTGIDYWLGDRSASTSLPFQNLARLEVSGILKAENEHTIVLVYVKNGSNLVFQQIHCRLTLWLWSSVDQWLIW